jgi:hypothetical protein
MLGATVKPRLLGLEWANSIGCSGSRSTHPLKRNKMPQIGSLRPFPSTDVKVSHRWKRMESPLQQSILNKSPKPASRKT